MRGGFAALGRAPGVRCNPGLPPGRGGVGWGGVGWGGVGWGGLKRRPGSVASSAGRAWLASDAGPA
ncbi:hypothetical protein C0Q60_09260 [Streptomyces albidoflavus]|nr:hypothetical protein C0Q60_09260 [Streptomyces albidoflavus]RZE00670.1 hypothetical protein C0Q62_09160 [Streptomyces albidoflavus]